MGRLREVASSSFAAVMAAARARMRGGGAELSRIGAREGGERRGARRPQEGKDRGGTVQDGCSRTHWAGIVPPGAAHGKDGAGHACEPQRAKR